MLPRYVFVCHSGPEFDALTRAFSVGIPQASTNTPVVKGFKGFGELNNSFVAYALVSVLHPDYL